LDGDTLSPAVDDVKEKITPFLVRTLLVLGANDNPAVSKFLAMIVLYEIGNRVGRGYFAHRPIRQVDPNSLGVITIGTPLVTV
jgi:hypothetical protein